MRALLHDGDRLADEELLALYPWPAMGPWLRANMVMSLDGAVADGAGLSRGLSGEADRRLFGLLRALSDAILVGAGTVRNEGYRPARPRFPELRAGRRPAPVIAIVSRSLDLDPASELFSTPVERPIVITSTRAPSDRRARIAEVADVISCGQDDVDLRLARDALREQGLTRVHCEGGPALLAGVVASGLLDELLLTLSPILAAGDTVQRGLVSLPLPVEQRMTLAHVLESEGSLFMRYVRA